MQFYTTTTLGPNQHLTKEGFLCCVGVPVARVGEMIYGPNETPITVGPEGFVRIMRDADEVFRPETIASCNGKGVVIDHPAEDVVPGNWRILEMGVMVDARRGEGNDQDVLLADLLIKDPEAIRLIREDGLREVSLGYDAEYYELGPGVGRQANIVVNHIALVKRGRCGPRCAIGDQATLAEEITMSRRTVDRQARFFDKLRRAFKAKDEAAFEEIVKDAEEGEENDDTRETADNGGVHLHLGGNNDDEPTIHPDLDKRIKALEDGHGQIMDTLTKVIDSVAKLTKDAEGNTALEGSLQMEAPPGTGDQAVKAKDSEFLGDAFQETVSLAEVMAPGIAVPTYDRAAAPARTLDSIVALRRTALDLAYARPQLRGVIESNLSGATFDTKKMTHDSLRSLFKAVGTAAKLVNNKATEVVTAKANTARPIMTIADINRRNAAKYATH